MEKYLETVNEDNFSKSYDGLVRIIEEFKTRGLLKHDVQKILVQIDDQGLDQYQEEVIIEIGNRIVGFCTPGKEINW